MGAIKKLFARVFNTCECCGKKLKPEDMKYSLTMETWIEDPERTSGYDCRVCHECVSTLKIYEMVSRINVIRKLKKEE